MFNDSRDDEGRALRKRAEALLERASGPATELSAAETADLVHELRTHHIELQMQNEGLREAHRELSLSRDRYADLYDFAPVGYMTLNDQSVVVEANRTLASMLGVSRQELLGRRFSDFVHAQDQNSCYLYFNELGHGQGCAACSVRLLAAGAEPFWAELDSMRGEDQAAGGPSLRAVVRNVTEQHNLRAEKWALAQQLHQSQKLESLGVLAGGIAHDFNNMLMAILGNANLARLDLTADSKAGENIRNIEDVVVKAAELVKQMLAYAGKSAVKVEPVDLQELIAESMPLLKVAVSRKATLDYEFAPERTCLVADRSQVQQVLMNLVINASDSLDGRTGVISVSTGMTSAEGEKRDGEEEPQHVTSGVLAATGDYAYLEVGDSGCGMAPETIQRVFDPFFSTKF